MCCKEEFIICRMSVKAHGDTFISGDTAAAGGIIALQCNVKAVLLFISGDTSAGRIII